MTPQEALAVWESDYKGRPGKFEGESAAALYYQDAMLNGDGDEHGEGCLDFVVTQEEAAAFGLRLGQIVHLEEDDNGFVYLS